MLAQWKRIRCGVGSGVFQHHPFELRTVIKGTVLENPSLGGAAAMPFTAWRILES